LFRRFLKKHMGLGKSRLKCKANTSIALIDTRLS